MISAVTIWTDDAKGWEFQLEQRHPVTRQAEMLYHSRSGFPNLKAAASHALTLAECCDRHGPPTQPAASGEKPL